MTMGGFVSFKYSDSTININNIDSGGFAKLGEHCVSVRPENRYVLFSHIGYLNTNKKSIYVISTVNKDGNYNTLDFEWDEFNYTPLNISYISRNNIVVDSSYNDATYNVYNTPFIEYDGISSNTLQLVKDNVFQDDYYINEATGYNNIDYYASQNTASGIYPGSSISYINDVPNIYSNNTRIWVVNVASNLETRGRSNVSLNRDNRCMFEKDGDVHNYTYPSQCSLINNQEYDLLLAGDDFDDAKVILRGSAIDKYDICEHLSTPTSTYISNIDRCFVDIKVSRSSVLNENNWKSTALCVSPVSEIDRIEDMHIELIDGMWIGDEIL